MEKVYEVLNNIDIIDFFSNNDLERQIKQCIIEHRDNANKNQDKVVAQKCQIEIDVFNFVIRGDEISYTFAGTDVNGIPYEYPNLKSFKNEDFDYLAERLDNSSNLYLRARYSHILWQSVKKHNKYALIASQAYTEITQTLYKVFDNTDNYLIRHNIVNLIENAILVASPFKKSDEYLEARQLFMTIVKYPYISNKQYLNTSLIYCMLEQNKIFKQSDFIGIEDDLYKIAQTEDNFRKIDILQLGKKVDNKLGNKNLYWDKEIGQCYEKMSYERENETNLISMQFAQEALKYYRKAKDQEKIIDLTKRYKKLKENSRLGNFSSKIDVTESIKFIQKFSEQISEKNTEQILYTLMYSSFILPKYDDLEKQALEQNNKYPIHLLGSTKIIDSSGHISEQFDTVEEQIYYSILQNFHFQIQFYCSFLLRELFIKSILKGKLTPSEIINFMITKLWLGRDITRPMKQGENETYNWVNLLAPAINDYIVQLYFHLQNHQNTINLVLCIDSLVLKIEGILRDICDLRGGTSFFFTSDKKGNNVAREKDINALLHEEEIKNFLSQDDLLFLKFLLVEKAGFNLRNNIAHSLFRHINKYSIDYMNLLIIAILKLAKDEYYPLADKTSSNE